VSVEFYEENHREFIKDTIHVDMSELYQPFCQMLPMGAKILDAGCGSGRDTQFFIAAGFEVVAIDASSKMVEATRKLTGADCRKMSFEDLSLENDFDAIWACASLLHVKRKNLVLVLNDLTKVLLPSGVFYVSFKFGSHERQNDLRYFNDMTPELMEMTLADVPDLTISRMWITSDARPMRESEKWLNYILLKEAT